MSDTMNIPAISYTNKDFRSIYPEMLDLAKQLTNKWDPSRSNESDPGVVLLKEAAFVADHNNYNIDKNILENFLPSATQDISVRNITEMNGYTPRYYVSANGQVSFKWNKPESETMSIFTIPAFTLVLSDVEDSISYTQVSDIVIMSDQISSGTFIEGTLQTLAINENQVIYLDNLDDNNRLYFPESLVAQNGVYVRNINVDDYNDLWERNNYLLTQPTGSHCYKIDYDSNKDLPYIEFPSDISNLIGDGLQIQYISTSGEAGNVSANTLTKIVSPSKIVINNGIDEVEISTENFIPWNPGSITNGKNPETIDEMYKSFRKVVGTFETLVTCLDYSNKIYTLTDVFDNPYVSNVRVADRRNDFNKSMNIVSYDVNSGNRYFENVSIKPCSLTFKGIVDKLPSSGANGDMVLLSEDNNLYVNIGTTGVMWRNSKDKINYNDFALLTSAMTPYDLAIYALTVFSLADYSPLNPFGAYNNSFTPVSNNVLEIIKGEIEENKCICHTYKNIDTDDIFCFKNYVPLNVTLYLYNKIKENVKDDILNNIYIALSQNFNPRNLEFGEKINLEAVKNVIISADSRIKDASIEIKDTDAEGNKLIKLFGMKKEGNDVPVSTISGQTDLLIDIIAKNVLAGRVCLFNFNDDFNYDFGQVDGIDTLEGTQISTEVEISLNKDAIPTNYYTSEVKREVTVMTSSGDTSTLPAYNYKLDAPNNKVGDVIKNIAQGSSYTLVGDDTLTITPIDVNTGKPLKKQAIEYKSKGEISYTIQNQLAADLENNKTESLLPAGEMTINKDDITISENKGILNLNYTLNENETIQILHPNYFSETTYTTYVNYRYIGKTTDRIYANTEHTLKAGEKIVIIYSQEGSTQQVILDEGQIVRTSFNLIPTDETNGVGNKKSWTDPRTGIVYENATFKQLGSNQTISVRKQMNTILNSSGIWCYWILNNDDNQLFYSGQHERILNNNEYFIYTNSSLDEMMILGSGTKLTRVDNNDSWWRIPKTIVEISSLSTNGVGVNVPWQKSIDFVNNNFTITEMNVITLGEGDRITIFDWTNMSETKEGTDDEYILNNVLQSCNGSIRYVAAGSETVLPAVENFYSIRSRLDINCSKNVPQRLYTITDRPDNGNVVQKFTIGSETIIAEQDKPLYVQSSRPIMAVGDLVVFNEKIRLYAYSLDGKAYKRSIIVKDEGETNEYNFNYTSSNGDYIIPIHISGNATRVYVSISGTREGDDTYKLKDYNNSNIQADKMLILEGDTSYYLQPVVKGSPQKGEELTITIEYDAGEYTTNQSILIGDIIIINGLNSEINVGKGGSITLKKILDKMNSLISGSDNSNVKFYYPYIPDNSIAMNNTDFEDPNVAYDPNNLINEMTIPFIDFANSSFIIPKNMFIQEIYVNEV